MKKCSRSDELVVEVDICAVVGYHLHSVWSFILLILICWMASRLHRLSGRDKYSLFLTTSFLYLSIIFVHASFLTGRGPRERWRCNFLLPIKSRYFINLGIWCIRRRSWAPGGPPWAIWWSPTNYFDLNIFIHSFIYFRCFQISQERWNR